MPACKAEFWRIGTAYELKLNSARQARNELNLRTQALPLAAD
jgi:hypothetical protein